MPKPRRNRTPRDPRTPRLERLANWQVDGEFDSQKVWGSVAFTAQRKPRRMPSRSQPSPFAAKVTGKPVVSYVDQAATLAAWQRQDAARAAARAQIDDARNARIAELRAIARSLDSVTESSNQKGSI